MWKQKDRAWDLLSRLYSLDADQVAHEALQWLAQQMRAEKAFWFPKQTLSRELARRMQPQTPLFTMTERGSRIQGLRDNASEFESTLLAWQHLLENDFRAVQHSRATGRVLLPMFAFDQGECVGHFALEGGDGIAAFMVADDFELICGMIGRHLGLAYKHLEVVAQTYRDDLTDLYNQRYLPVVLEQEMQRSQRQNSPFSVLFLDVDFFKSVNDRNGHLVGSQVLVELSRLLRESIRRTDYAFRYGGDEYVIVLTGASAQNAFLVAERLRAKTQQSSFTIAGMDVKVTISIGVACYPDHAESSEELLQIADEAMYHGKHKSRNIVYLAS